MRRALVMMSLLWIVGSQPVSAATKTWAASAAGNASTAGNWSPSGAPASGDDVVFDGTSVQNCTWDINLGGYNFGSFSMNAGYTGTVTLGIALPITNALTIHAGTLNTSGTNYNVTPGSYSQDGGTFTANGSTITAGGNWSQTAGTFTMGTSTVKVQATANVGATSNFYNLTVGAVNNTTNTVTMTSNITVTNVLTIAESNDILTQDATNRTMTLSGTGSVLVTNSGTISGVNTVSYTATSGTTTVASATYNNLTINGSGGTFNAGGSMTANGTFTLSNGTFSTTGSNYGLTVGSYSQGGGTFTANSSVITVTAGGLAITAGTFNTNTSTVTFTATSGTNSIAGTTYNNLTINGNGGTFNAAAAMTVNGTMTVTAGTFSGNGQNITLKGTVGAGGVCLILNGANGTYKTSSSGTHTFGDNGNDSVTISAGTFRMEAPDESSSTYLVRYAGLAWTNSGGTVLYDAPAASSPTILTTIDPYYNLDINDADGNTYTFSAGSAITVNNNLTVTAGTLQLGAATTVNGSVTASGTLNLNNKSLTVNGGTIQGAGTITCSACTGGTVQVLGTGNLGTAGAGGSYTFYDLTIGGGATSAATTVPSSSTVTIAVEHQLTITTKTTTPYNSLDGGGATFKLHKASNNQTTSRPFLLGTNASFTPSTSTLIYESQTSGTICDVVNADVYNLQVNASGVTYHFSQDPTISGVLTIGTGATLNAETYTVTLSGSGTPLSRSGTFTASTSTVIYSSGSGVTALASAAMTGSNALYNLTINGTGTFTAGVDLTVSNDLTMTAGTLGGTNNVTVNGNVASTSGAINLTSGTFTQNVGSNKNFGATSGSTAWTFASLTFSASSGTPTITTQTGGTGTLTVSSVLTIGASTTLDAGNRTWTLSGSGTPFSISGTFTPNTSTIKYSHGVAETVNVASTTYSKLLLTVPSAVAPTYKLLGAITVSNTAAGALSITGVGFGGVPVLDTDSTNNYSVTVSGGVTINGGFGGAGSFAANASSISVGGNWNCASATCTFTAGTSTVTLTGGAGGSPTITSSGQSFYNLTVNASGITYAMNDALTATNNLNVTAGTLSTGALTVTAKNLTINGGTLSMGSSGSTLKISTSGTFSMSSGTFSASDVATKPMITTSDTATPTYVGVSLTGGTLNASSLQVDYLKSTGFVIGSGVTITNFNKVTWGDSSNVYHGQAASGEKILDITSQTVSLQNHVFPTTWSSQDSTDCNVRSNTSGVVTMWDWTGAYGGSSYSCNNSVGEVVWQPSGGRGGSSGTHEFPAIY